MSSARDVNVAVAGDAWSVEAGAWSLGGNWAPSASTTRRGCRRWSGFHDADEAGRGGVVAGLTAR